MPNNVPGLTLAGLPPRIQPAGHGHGRHSSFTWLNTAETPSRRLTFGLGIDAGFLVAAPATTSPGDKDSFSAEELAYFAGPQFCAQAQPPSPRASASATVPSPPPSPTTLGPFNDLSHLSRATPTACTPTPTLAYTHEPACVAPQEIYAAKSKHWLALLGSWSWTQPWPLVAISYQPLANPAELQQAVDEINKLQLQSHAELVQDYVLQLSMPAALNEFLQQHNFATLKVRGATPQPNVQLATPSSLRGKSPRREAPAASLVAQAVATPTPAPAASPSHSFSPSPSPSRSRSRSPTPTTEASFQSFLQPYDVAPGRMEPWETSPPASPAASPPPAPRPAAPSPQTLLSLVWRQLPNQQVFTLLPAPGPNRDFLLRAVLQAWCETDVTFTLFSGRASRQALLVDALGPLNAWLAQADLQVIRPLCTTLDDHVWLERFFGVSQERD